MDELEAGVTRCFSAIFPDLDQASMLDATPYTLSDWDSVATVTLLATVEQELSIEIDPEDVSEFVSYQRIVSYVRRRKAGMSAA
jgi:acyl carrier protein